MTKKVVISGYYGFGNFGDELILSVLVQHLKSMGIETVVLSSNPRKTSMEHFVNSINTFSFNQVSGLLKQSDILVSGGGSLLQDVTSVKSLLYYLWVIFTALRHRKDVIIFAQGIGPINNKFAALITKFLLKRCRYISVRDEKSQQLLENWGIKANLLCDPAYSLNIQPTHNTGIVGVQLRDFSTMNDTLLKKLARQIVKDFSDKKIRIFALQKNIDNAICKRFENMLKNINPDIKTEFIDEDIAYKLIEVEYLIAMRFHALIVALKAGIRCTGINYDIKVENLAKSANIPLISMNAIEDLDKIFSSLRALNPDNLREYANSQKFDWSGIDEVLN